MSSTLPNEVIGLVVDEIWESQDIRTVCSFSLVSKSFTPPCQERLWRTVILHSSGASYQSRTSLMQAKTICSSPHIGGYVRFLNLQVVSSEPFLYKEQGEDLESYGRALKLMPNLAEFRLAYTGGRSFTTLPFGLFPRSLREAVVQIVTDRGLRSLTLVKVAAFPPDAMKEALGHLERLELLKCSVHVMGSSVRPGAQIAVAALTTLKCDSDSYLVLNLFAQPPPECHFAQVPCAFSNLATLELSASTFIQDHSLFRQATSLQYLHLEILKSAGQVRLHTILKEIRPALTRLKLSLHHDNVENLITNPLMSAVVDDFLRMKALQTLEIDVYLDAHCRQLNWRSAMRNTDTRHTTWAKFDEAISKLQGPKEVRVRFGIEYMEKGWLVVTREAAEGVRDHILDTVYPSQFEHLRGRRDRAEVVFEFAVNLKAL